MLKGLGNLGDMAGMMKKAQQMQKQMEQMQNELHNLMVTGESGAGLVKATCSATCGRVVGISIIILKQSSVGIIPVDC